MVWKSNPAPSAVARQSLRSGHVIRRMERGQRISGGSALTAAMAMAMAVPVEPMRRATEAAISHATILGPPSIRVGPLLGSAVAAPNETHRYGADGCSTHHGQDHAARAFHGAVPCAVLFRSKR